MCINVSNEVVTENPRNIGTACTSSSVRPACGFPPPKSIAADGVHLAYRHFLVQRYDILKKSTLFSYFFTAAPHARCAASPTAVRPTDARMYISPRFYFQDRSAIFLSALLDRTQVNSMSSRTRARYPLLTQVFILQSFTRLLNWLFFSDFRVKDFYFPILHPLSPSSFIRLRGGTFYQFT